MENCQDLFIIGGGINGTGIAADAAGRGLSVTLCERNDLASGTSSHSTKLIHGGLRYLEYYEFNLVRKALREREILMRRAPHLIAPLQFRLPYEKHLRPAWMIRIGLFLYDHLAKRQTIPDSQSIKFHGDILKKTFTRGFSYYDCFTDDARLVIANALSAKENHATILTHTEFVSAIRENQLWKIKVKNMATQAVSDFYAKALINAAGPWIDPINQKIADNQSNFSVQLVKGSHIVVPKLYAGEYAFILQNADNRIVFTIPFHNDFTLIGTTDLVVESADSIRIQDDEKIYLCSIVNHYFNKTISPSDIVWSYSGVRCLQGQNQENPSKTTRDYKLLLETKNNAPLLTVIGGKITTFRDLAIDALEQLKPFFPNMGPSWTAEKSLPGGDFPQHDFQAYCDAFQKQYAWLPQALAKRYMKNYGTRAHLILQNAESLSDLGKLFGANLYQKEVEYLVKEEWATTADDILWRRTKLGLYFAREEIEQLAQFL